ncbi:hypothetical protein VTH06DRAFT_4468 [Thermothelomyces fergusii]
MSQAAGIRRSERDWRRSVGEIWSAVLPVRQTMEPAASAFIVPTPVNAQKRKVVGC